MSTKAERDARLDELKRATEEWAQKRTDQLKQRVDVAKRILKGRTGSERLMSHATQTVSNNLVADINAFLVG
jgi:hypothetical protein